MNNRSCCIISNENDQALPLREQGLAPQLTHNAELRTARRLRTALLVDPGALCLHHLCRIYFDLRTLSHGNLRLLRIGSQTQVAYGKAIFFSAPILLQIS